MPVWWADWKMTPERTGLAVGALAVLAGGVLAARSFLVQKPSPEETERRRRLQIHRDGKLGDGEAIDIDPERPTVTFSYSVAGVGYTAAQDITSLRAMLPEDLMTIIGPASIKYDPRNPANSIVLCEDWNGLRLNSPALGKS
jgi:hypothetical protein